jgi:hypothetical protein
MVSQPAIIYCILNKSEKFTKVALREREGFQCGSARWQEREEGKERWQEERDEATSNKGGGGVLGLGIRCVTV